MASTSIIERMQRNPMWWDAFVMLMVAPLTFLATGGLAYEESSPVVGWLLALLFTVPLLWRRSRPDLCAALVAAGHLLQVAAMDTMLPGNFVIILVLYAVAVHSTPTRSRFWLAVGLAGAVMGAIDWNYQDLPYSTANSLEMKLMRGAFHFVLLAAVVLASWFAGQWGRSRRLAIESLHQRAEALEREREQGRARIAEEERNRLAREMHDIVAHSLSVIVVQADGAGYLAGADELGDAEARLAQVTKAIETIRGTARTALGETRRLVGVLRQDGDETELAPAATLDQIADLVAPLQQAAFPAQFSLTGSPDAHEPLSAGAEMALYRVAQESLTNVMKHAGPGASVHVVLDHAPQGVTLVVRDTGRGAAASVDGQYGDGLGHGLVGMRERMAAWDGRLDAGTRLDGGFEVRASIPAHPATSEPEPR